jgi:hypothetical protein
MRIQLTLIEPHYGVARPSIVCGPRRVFTFALSPLLLTKLPRADFARVGKVNAFPPRDSSCMRASSMRDNRARDVSDVPQDSFASASHFLALDIIGAIDYSPVSTKSKSGDVRSCETCGKIKSCWPVFLKISLIQSYVYLPSLYRDNVYSFLCIYLFFR